MNERRLVAIPNGPAPTPGVAGMVPAGRTRGARAASIPRVQLQSKAPDGMERPGGVLVDGGQLAQGELGKARAAQVAGSAVAGAVVDVGQAIGGHIQRVVMARETAEVEWARARMDAAFDAYRAGLSEDPSDWQEGWKAASEEVKADILGEGKKLSSALRGKLDADFNKWSYASGARLSQMAVAQNAQIAKTLTELTLQQREEMEDVAGYESTIANAIHSGTMTPEIGAMKIQNMRRNVQRAQDWRFARSDPHQADALMGAGGFDNMAPADKEKLKATIELEKERKVADEEEFIVGAIAEREDMPEDELETLLVNSHIPEAKQKKLRRVWRNENPDFEYIADTEKKILGMTSATKEIERLRMKQEVIEHFPDDYRGHALRLLELSTRDHTTDPLKQNLRDLRTYTDGLVDRIAEDYSNRSFRDALGNVDPAAVANEKVMQSRKWAAWLQANPEQGYEGAVKEINKTSLGRGSAAGGAAAKPVLKTEEQKKKDAEDFINRHRKP